jgi:hypothetical protein
LKYDPHHDVDQTVWLALDEFERIDSVKEYHRRKRIRLPNENVHAAIHVMVENQIALGDSYPASAVLSRLMNEGLDRHEAIHAIGSVLAEQLYGTLKAERSEADLNAVYLDKLSKLTAESWRKLGTS